jgi:uncharacterized membrane protein
MKNTFTKYTSGAALALVIGAAVSVASGVVHAKEDSNKEKCYGVSLKGKNDCGGKGVSCAGTSKKDYEGEAWKYVAKGTCETMKSPSSPTGMGQLKAFKEMAAK